MESSISTSVAWLVGLICLGVGLAIGILVTRLSPGTRRHTEALETQLAEQQRQFDGYREQVSSHFQQTSELVQKMTDSYRDVYEHLARGSQALCEDPVSTPRLDIPETPLIGEQAPSGRPAGTPPPATEFTDAETDPLAEDPDAFLGDAPHIPDLDEQTVAATPHTPSK